MKALRRSRLTRNGARIIPDRSRNIRRTIPIIRTCSITPPWRWRSGTIWSGRSGWCESLVCIDRQSHSRQYAGLRTSFLDLQRGFPKLAKTGGAVRSRLKLPVSGKDMVEIPQAAGECFAISLDQALTEDQLERRRAVGS